MEQPCPIIHQFPQFDKKYKVIIKTEFSNDYFEKMTWVNDNSIGSVDIKNMTTPGINTYEDNIYFAFEEPSDATFFRIKFSL
jgi:hypothetical protein